MAEKKAEPKSSGKKYITSVRMTTKDGDVIAMPGDEVTLSPSEAKSLGSRVQEA